MVCEVVGKSKRPYELRDERSGQVRCGMSCRVSLHIGSYESDTPNGVYGDGEQFIELRAPESIVDNINVGDTLSVEIDDKKTRIKSAMVQIDSGGFMPI